MQIKRADPFSVRCAPTASLARECNCAFFMIIAQRIFERRSFNTYLLKNVVDPLTKENNEYHCNIPYAPTVFTVVLYTKDNIIIHGNPTIFTEKIPHCDNSQLITILTLSASSYIKSPSPSIVIENTINRPFTLSLSSKTNSARPPRQSWFFVAPHLPSKHTWRAPRRWERYCTQ